MTVDTAGDGGAQARHRPAGQGRRRRRDHRGVPRSTAAVLTEYRGLTVTQLTELRVALGADTHVRRRQEHPDEASPRTRPAWRTSTPCCTGPTAVAFVKGDPVEAAKALRDFARANPALVVKGGVVDGTPLTADEVRKLADLESREVLLAKLAGALQASLSNAVELFNAPLAQAARLAGALQAKAEQDPSVHARRRRHAGARGRRGAADSTRRRLRRPPRPRPTDSTTETA